MELSKKLPAQLLGWYDKGHRGLPWRDHPIPYYVWISEIMLQQTRVEAVKPYFLRFIKTLPDVKALACAEEETLLKLWEGLGYYRRVYHLQKAAQMIVERYGGEIPGTYAQLRSLPGVGDYTAGAIASIAFGQPKAAVDGNVLRVIMRFCGDYRDITALTVKREVTKALEEIYPPDRCGDFTQSLMELGATVCLPNGIPKCDQCPLAGDCLAHLTNCTDELPVKKQKKARKIQLYTLLILRCQGKIAIRKRTRQGLLYRMWELPNTEGQLSLKEAAKFAEGLGVCPASVNFYGKAVHIFTHIEWKMAAYVVDCKEWGDASLRWVSTGELEKNFGLPSAFRHFSGAWQEKGDSVSGKNLSK